MMKEPDIKLASNRCKHRCIETELQDKRNINYLETVSSLHQLSKNFVTVLIQIYGDIRIVSKEPAGQSGM